MCACVRSLNLRCPAVHPLQAAKVKLGAIKSIVDSNFAPAPVPLGFANTAGELTDWGMVVVVHCLPGLRPCVTTGQVQQLGRPAAAP